MFQSIKGAVGLRPFLLNLIMASICTYMYCLYIPIKGLCRLMAVSNMIKSHTMFPRCDLVLCPLQSITALFNLLCANTKSNKTVAIIIRLRFKYNL
jgi:hypothetical protein